MSKPMGMWVVLVAAATVMAESGDYSTTITSDYGLGLLNMIMDTNSSQLCSYVSCQEPMSPSACPEKTMFLENTSQFGCCGACVNFKEGGEICTGSIDEDFGGGYTMDSKKPSVDLLASFYNTSENKIVQSSWCDYSLECMNTKHGWRCFANTTVKTCTNVLGHYLNDIQNSDLYKIYRDDYRWKPKCSRDGKYEAKQCKGPLDKQRCVCVDPDGNRLFGAAFPEQEELYNSMNCKCSLKAWEKKQAGQSSVTLHCLENGNFEPLQCEEGWCHCVDPTTGNLYGSRLPETAMHMLTCYNKTTVGERYLRRCDSEFHAHAMLLDAMADSGVRGPESLTTCDQDGSYTSKQCDQEMCRCWDKYKFQSIAHPSGEDCQCAVDREYYKETNSKISVKCMVNSGSYAEIQVQGSFKFCVDKDGIRSGPLVKNLQEYTLDCAYSKLCQESGAGNGNCDKVCMVPEGVCPNEAYADYNIQV